MWLHDLDEFIAKLDEVEGKENQETKDQQETQQKGFKKVAADWLGPKMLYDQ